MEKKKIILPKLRYENAPETNMQLHIGFNEEKSFLRTDNRDVILDLSEQFAEERSDCNRYKLYGKIKMIFRNLYLGESYYNFLKERLALDGDGSDGIFDGYLPYNEFAFLRNDVYREIISGTSISVLSGFTGFSIITGGTVGHLSITAAEAPYHNWNIYLSYIYDHDDVYSMKYTLTGGTILSFVSGDGIPFRVEESSTKYILTSPVKHGISQGEYIIIDSRYYYVNSVGNQIYNSENYVINILKSQLSGVTFNTVITGKRCTDIKDKNNSTSQYYVHKHKTLTSIDDYILDKVGFESPIWEDERKIIFENSAGENDVLVERNRMESVLFDFKEPFILSGITNNLGYTPTELYASVIFRNGNGYFNYPPKVGYSFNMHDSWIDEHFDGDTSKEIFIPSTGFTKDLISFTAGLSIPEGTELYGAFVEYNPKEMKERIISESFHKIISNANVFNHGQELDEIYSGATPTNPIGLLYQPHYRFKIRELSPYIESSDPNAIVENLPENAIYFPDEKLWRWRDLYDDGYIDPDGYGTDYPYLNNIHYIHNDINFYIRNEQIYTNKNDGIISFYKRGDKNTCYANIVEIVSTPTVTPTVTPTIMPTPSITISASMPITPSITPSLTKTITPSVTPSLSISKTPSLSISRTPSRTPSLSISKTPSITPSITSSISKTPSITPSLSLSRTPSRTPSLSISSTPSRTPSLSLTRTPSITPSLSLTRTPSRTPSITPSLSLTRTPSITPSLSLSKTPSITPSLSMSRTPTITPSRTPTITPSHTPSITPTMPAYGYGALTAHNHTTYSDACAHDPGDVDDVLYLPPNHEVPIIGDYFYTDTSYVTPFVGETNKWYYVIRNAYRWAIIIDGAGTVDDVYDCINPSPTPSISKTPSLSISKTPTPSIPQVVHVYVKNNCAYGAARITNVTVGGSAVTDLGLPMDGPTGSAMGHSPQVVGTYTIIVTIDQTSDDTNCTCIGSDSASYCSSRNSNGTLSFPGIVTNSSVAVDITLADGACP